MTAPADVAADRWRHLYESTLASLREMTTLRARTTARHGALRRGVLSAMQQAWPREMVALAQRTDGGLDGLTDDALLDMLMFFLAQRPAAAAPDRSGGGDADSRPTAAAEAPDHPGSGDAHPQVRADVAPPPTPPSSSSAGEISWSDMWGGPSDPDQPPPPPPPPDDGTDWEQPASQPAPTGGGGPAATPMDLGDADELDAILNPAPPAPAAGPAAADGPAQPAPEDDGSGQPDGASPDAGEDAGRRELPSGPSADVADGPADNGPDHRVTPALKPDAAPRPASRGRKGRKPIRTKASAATTPPATAGSAADRLLEAVEVPRPVFAADLSGVADPDTIQGWVADLKRSQATAPVRVVTGTKAHSSGRGRLLLPWAAMEDESSKVAGSWWAEAVVRYRSHALYAVAVMLHSVASGVVSHDFGDDLAMVRTNSQRGLQAVGLLLSDVTDANCPADAAIGTLVEQMQRERLDVCVLLTRKPTKVDPIAAAVERHCARVGWTPPFDIVTTTVADWAGGRPTTTSLT